MSIRTRILPINGAGVAVHESPGKGSPIVLLHGHWSTRFAFAPLLEGPLGQEHRLIAIDLPGEGASDPPVDRIAAYSTPGFAAVIVSVAQALELEKAVFTGWSLGGHLLIEAMPALGRASGFCILGTPPLRYPPNLGEAFLPHPVVDVLFEPVISDEACDVWADAMVPRSSPLWASVRDHVRASDGSRRAQLGASIGTVGYRDEPGVLASLQQPLAVIHGEQDCLISLPYIASLRLPTLWRGAVQVVVGATHAIQWSAPEALSDLLLDFRRAV